MIIITPVSVYNSFLENAPSRRTNPETWEIRLSVSCFISSKNLPAHICEDGQKPLQLFIKEAGYRKPLRMPSSLVSRKNTIPFVFWQICIQTWSLFYLFYIDLTHLDIWNHISYCLLSFWPPILCMVCKNILCQHTKWKSLNRIPSISKFILQREVFVYSMNESKLRGVRYPNPQPFESLCGAFKGRSHDSSAWLFSKGPPPLVKCFETNMLLLFYWPWQGQRADWPGHTHSL